MGKRNRDQSSAPPTDWSTERTLAAAEAEQDEWTEADEAKETACSCGNRSFLLQAFFAVNDGVLGREPLEVEGLTCPECGREYEAVPTGDGRVLRGEFVGFADADEE